MPVHEQFGPYQLLNELGRGGMGIVFAARDERLSREVAIKVLPPDLLQDGTAQQRFLTEARSAAALEHPSILPIYDVGQEQGYSYFVMPRIQGADLSDRLTAGVPWPLAEALPLLQQLADAIDFAHANGVIHRDLKPGNVLVDEQGKAWLMDFGLAKALDGEERGLTRTGMIVGTPEYFSPEQAKGLPATPASDRYSFGVLAWHLLTGRPPFEGESLVAVALKHVQEAPPDLRSAAPHLPTQVIAALERMLAKDPAVRFGTATEFVATLQGRAASPPAAPPTPQPADPPAPPAPANRRHLMVLAVVLGLSGIGLLGGYGIGSLSSHPSQSSTTQQTRAPATPDFVAVPNVVGLEEASAAERLRAMGLVAAAVSNAPSPMPAGTVTHQLPEAGSQAQVNDTVSLTLSTGPVAPPLPTVTPTAPSAGVHTATGAEREEIMATVTVWDEAWERQDLDMHIATYAPDARIFTNGKWYSRDEYYDHETGIFGTARRIEVSRDRADVTVEGDIATARCAMTYRRHGGPRGDYSSSGTLTLRLRRTNEGWRIVEDHFRG